MFRGLSSIFGSARNYGLGWIGQVILIGWKCSATLTVKLNYAPNKKYEVLSATEQHDKEIFIVPSVNDLLEQPLQNETSEDEIMHDQVGQNELENSDEDQIMQEDDPDYSLVRDRSRSPRERNMGERKGE